MNSFLTLIENDLRRQMQCRKNASKLPTYIILVVTEELWNAAFPTLKERNNWLSTNSAEMANYVEIKFPGKRWRRNGGMNILGMRIPINAPILQEPD